MARRGWSVGAVVAALVIPMAAAAPASAHVVTTSFYGAIVLKDQAPAAPYPASLSLAAPGKITDVSVTVRGLSHDYPDDIAIALKGPDGHSLMLMNGVGDDTDVSGVDLTFTDSAPDLLPNTGGFATGSYRPTSYYPVTNFTPPGPTDWASPGPAGTATFASTFGGDSPTGTWQLFVEDFDHPGTGQIAGGWTLTVTTDLHTITVAAPTGAGQGVILGPGLNCPGACTVDEPLGTQVTLTPVAASGSHFTGFGGSCSGALPCTFTVTDDVTVTARFDLDARDTTSPQTAIAKAPRRKTTKDFARFVFVADETGATFACALDGAPYLPCHSPDKLRGLHRGRHVFRVIATDAAGNPDPTPAVYRWKVLKKPRRHPQHG